MLAFLEREKKRDIEPYLREVYGKAEAHDGMLDYMDFPTFDTGNAGNGYGVQVDEDGTRRLWSRVVFFHK